METRGRMKEIHKYQLEQSEKLVVKLDKDLDRAYKQIDKLKIENQCQSRQICQWKLAYEKILVELLTGKEI